MLKVSELYIYPIKSLPGISLKQAEITERGFKYDRRWMLIDPNNRFITQREVPMMTQLPLEIKTNGIKVTNKANGQTLLIPFNAEKNERVDVIVWDDTCEAEFVSDEADEWFSKNLSIKCRLVYMPDDSRRIVDQRYAPESSITSFADAYPFLIIGQASLDELNSRLQMPLLMDRFRPNIVFAGGEAFTEDLIAHCKINGTDFYGVKLCARCPIPTINQQDASRGKEPLKALSKYRQKNNKVYFGQNLVHSGDGFISTGDQIEVISYNEDERFIIAQPLI